jgi:hypothetical protein
MIKASPSHHTVSVVFNLQLESSSVELLQTPDPPPIF